MRIARKLVLGLIAFVVVAAAVVLFPAHVQVRGVSPQLPSTAQLRELLDRPDGPVAVHYVNTSTQATGLVGTLGHTVFLVEWENGDLFMIDAGMDEPTAIEFGRMFELFGAEPAVSYGTAAELVGADIAKVQGVGFTHLHIDHTQGIESFCSVRGEGATVFQTSSQQSLHNMHTSEGDRLIRASCLEPATIDAQGLVEIDRFPGLGIVALGGHTPGSTMFVVPVDGKLWLFSGDTTNSKANLLDNTGKGFVYSYLVVPENTSRTQQLRLWLADLDALPDVQVVVSHDLIDIEASDLNPWPAE